MEQGVSVYSVPDGVSSRLGTELVPCSTIYIDGTRNTWNMQDLALSLFHGLIQVYKALLPCLLEDPVDGSKPHLKG